MCKILEGKYKKLFNIKDSNEYYDTYLEIFDSLVNSSKPIDLEKIKCKLLEKNPWNDKDNVSNHFKTLAPTDSKILTPLLNDNINRLSNSNASIVINNRFENFEHAFDGNFNNPKVIIIGINPKMNSLEHAPYDNIEQIYDNPFDSYRKPLINDYYIKLDNGEPLKGGLFYARMDKIKHKELREKHYNLISSNEEYTPYALLEVFPYASENEKYWYKDEHGFEYKISSKIKSFFNFKTVLPSQIWLICLLTYSIKYSQLTNNNLTIFVTKKGKFKHNFLYPYFKLLEIDKYKNITVLEKKNNQQRSLSLGNVKNFFTESNLAVRTDSIEKFFEDIWGLKVYKFLLFDLDHTLWDFDTAEEVALTQFLKDQGVQDIQAFKDYYKPMNQGLWKDLEQKKISKKDLINSRFAIAFAHFGRQVDGEEMALRYQDYISQQGQSFSGAEDLLAELVERGYQLYGATNGVTAIQQGRLKQSAITTYFKEIFISEQLGTQKPEVAFYEKISNLIPGFAKEQALMIGDSLTADIAGGNAAGIDTVWYNPDYKENTSQAVPTYEVSDYHELLALLK